MNTRIFFCSIIVAVLLVSQQVVESASNICDNPKCVEESTKILSYIDPNSNPCEDFHEFACGNFARKAYGNRNLEFRKRNGYGMIQEIQEIYQEDIREEDHKMVKVAKKLYKECLDEEKIEKDLKTIKEALKEVGGWPVLEGSNWKEEGFDWMNATYALRRLGYDHTAFLDVRVQEEEVEKYILKVDGGYRNYIGRETLSDLVKVAVIFGAENEEIALQDLTKTFEFIEKLQELRYIYPVWEKHTIEEVQKTEGVINWLEFINTIGGLELTKDDSILYPTQKYLKQVIGLVSKTPKRTQANYMMWTAIKPLLRFLKKCPAKEGICNFITEHPKLCLQQIHLKLLVTGVPNPIDVIRLRRLPEEKKKKVEDLAMEVKLKFVETVNKSELVAEEIRNKFLEQLKEAKVVVGMVGNYFDDQIFDRSDVDMGNFEDTDSFFALLAKVTRNFKSAEYEKLSKPQFDYEQRMLLNEVPRYYFNKNILYIPVSSTRPLLFDEDRPEYLNYGALGTLIGTQLNNELIFYTEQQEDSKKSFRKARECLESEMKNETIADSERNLRVFSTIESIVGQEASYKAWMKNKGERQKLISLDYTPNQLFWISAASLVCQSAGRHQLERDYLTYIENAHIYSVSATVGHNLNFARDFNCPADSKLNPANKCNVL